MKKKFIPYPQFDEELDKAIAELKADKGKNKTKIKHVVQVIGRSELWLVRSGTKDAIQRESDLVALFKIIVEKETYLICQG